MNNQNKNPFEVVALVLEVPVESITIESGYRIHSGWDSLNHLSIINEIETEYNISIPDEDIEKYTTMEKIINFLRDEMNINW